MYQQNDVGAVGVLLGLLMFVGLGYLLVSYPWQILTGVIYFLFACWTVEAILVAIALLCGIVWQGSVAAKTWLKR
jgi:hypothetical protein